MAVRRVKIAAPFGGILSDLAQGSYPQGFQAMQNVMVRKTKLVSRPGLDMAHKIKAPDNRSVLNLTSFQDELNNWHTVLWTESHVYAWSGGPLPQDLVWNVLTDPTFILTATASGGTGYNPGELLYPLQAGAFGGILQVM